MGRLGDLVVTVGADTRTFNKRMNDVRRSTKATFGNIQRMGVGMSAAVTAPLAAMAAKSFGVAADFEQSMAKVAAVSGATAGEFKKLEQDALRLGSATRFTATEVSGLQLEFSKLDLARTKSPRSPNQRWPWHKRVEAIWRNPQTWRVRCCGRSVWTHQKRAALPMLWPRHLVAPRWTWIRSRIP